METAGFQNPAFQDPIPGARTPAEDPHVELGPIAHREEPLLV